MSNTDDTNPPNDNQLEPMPEGYRSERNDDGMPQHQNQLVRRGFSDTTLAHEGPATQALIAKETASIQARWVMAMKAPRSMADVRQVLIKECRQPGFAEKAIYSVPRGDGKVTGMSIRFAEVALRVFGNMSCEATTIFDTDSERLVRVLVTDYETNAHWQRDITVKKTVERKELRRGEQPIRTRVNSSHRTIFICEATDDDVRTKEAAEISKAARTGILRLIPGYIITEMRGLCEALQSDKARRDPNGEMKKITDSFAEINIMPNQLEEYLGHSVDQATAVEVVMLQQLFRGLREGDILSWSDAIDGAEAAKKKATTDHKAALAKTRADAAAAKAGQPATTAPATTAPAASTTTATTGPTTSSTKPETKPEAKSEPAKAAGTTAPTAQTDEKKTSAGKGTQAAKEKLKPQEKPAETKPELSVVPPADATGPAAQQGLTLTAQGPGELEWRNCPACDDRVEFPKGAPANKVCPGCERQE